MDQRPTNHMVLGQQLCSTSMHEALLDKAPTRPSIWTTRETKVPEKVMPGKGTRHSQDSGQEKHIFDEEFLCDPTELYEFVVSLG